MPAVDASVCSTKLSVCVGMTKKDADDNIHLNLRNACRHPPSTATEKVGPCGWLHGVA